MIPADAVTGWCPRHDPDQAEARRVQALQAAKTSHAPRALKPLIGDTWVSPDFDTPESRMRFREAVVAASGQGQLDDKRAALWLKAVDGAMAEDQGRKGSKSAPPSNLVVEVQRFSPNVAEPSNTGNGHSQEPA